LLEAYRLKRSAAFLPASSSFTLTSSSFFSAKSARFIITKDGTATTPTAMDAAATAALAAKGDSPTSPGEKRHTMAAANAALAPKSFVYLFTCPDTPFPV